MASSEHSSSNDHHYFYASKGKTKRKEFRVRFSEDEEDLIVRMYKLLGNRWSLIAGRIPGRTAEEIEKYWMEEKIATKKQKELVLPSQPMTEIQKQPR